MQVSEWTEKLSPVRARYRGREGECVMPRARIVGLLSLLGLLAASSACWTQSGSRVPYVAVREAQVREEVDLPLDAPGRERLLNFLRAGGNQDFVGEPTQDPAADQRYGRLLELLASVENLAPEHLTAGPYGTWFTAKPVRQVVDAREEAPPALDPPFAVTDGAYWWVFKRGEGSTFNRLIVFRALKPPTEPPEVRR